MNRQLIDSMINEVQAGRDPADVILAVLFEVKKKKGKKGKGGSWIQREDPKTHWKGWKKIAGSTSAKEITATLAKGAKTLKQATDRLNFFINRSGQGYNWSEPKYAANTKALLMLRNVPKFKKK